MNVEFQNIIEKFLYLCEQWSITILEQKDIPYGEQYKLEIDGYAIPLNLYYSKKKGFSYVLGGKKNYNAELLIDKLFGTILVKEKEQTLCHKWNFWAGSDESGKGDFFGALVVTCFCIERDKIPDLMKLGVMDSKKITDTKIVEIAHKIYRLFPGCFESVVLVPEKYNELYNKFTLRGKKLNEMLAWMHTRAIMNLKQKKDFEGVIVDKFASDKTLKNSLKEFKNIKLIHMTKAEADPAVAAASILSRYQFLMNMKSLSRKYQIEFPKGASQKVISIGKQFVEKFSAKELKQVSKTHFQTYKKICEEL
jgi:ribonuclease HIII